MKLSRKNTFRPIEVTIESQIELDAIIVLLGQTDALLTSDIPDEDLTSAIEAANKMREQFTRMNNNS